MSHINASIRTHWYLNFYNWWRRQQQQQCSSTTSIAILWYYELQVHRRATSVSAATSMISRHIVLGQTWAKPCSETVRRHVLVDITYTGHPVSVVTAAKYKLVSMNRGGIMVNSRDHMHHFVDFSYSFIGYSVIFKHFMVLNCAVCRYKVGMHDRTEWHSGCGARWYWQSNDNRRAFLAEQMQEDV